MFVEHVLVKLTFLKLKVILVTLHACIHTLPLDLTILEQIVSCRICYKQTQCSNTGSPLKKTAKMANKNMSGKTQRI